MAAGDPITNTEVTSAMVGIREELADFIERIDPTETPVVSNMRKGTVNATKFDWQVQELKPINRANAAKEGFDATFSSTTPTIRLENTCQLLFATWIVSDTADAVTTAGRAKESAYQQMLTGLQVRRDLEGVVTNNQAQNNVSEPRLMAGLPAMCGVQCVTTTSGVNQIVNTNGVGSAALAPGSLRDMSLSIIDDVLEQAYDNGGKPQQLLMPPRLKRAFSHLSPSYLAASNMNMMSSVEPAAYIGSVSIYLSDFGRMETAMDRFMLSGCILALDYDYLDLVTLPGRAWKNTPLAKTGSATKGMIEWEGGIRVRAPKGEGVIMAIQAPAAGSDQSGVVGGNPLA